MTHEQLPKRGMRSLTPDVLGSLAAGEYARRTDQSYEVKSLPPVEYDSYFGGKVHVVEAQPVRSDTLDEPAVFYAHGAGHGHEEPTVVEMARLGRDAFSFVVSGSREADSSFFVVGGREVLHDVSKKEVKYWAGAANVIVPKQQMREAATLLRLIEQRERPVDGVFQSESAGSGIIAAYTNPEAFRSIVLAYPGNFESQTGFIPRKVLQDKKARQQDAETRRQYLSAAEDRFTTSRSTGEAARALREQVRAPGFREEAAGLRYASLAPLLHSMRQRDNAPAVTLVAGLDDKIFPWQRYFETLVSSKDIDAMVFTPGGHAIGGRKDVLKEILDQFPSMEARDREAWLERPLKERIILPHGTTDRLAQEIYAYADDLDAR